MLGDLPIPFGSLSRGGITELRGLSRSPPLGHAAKWLSKLMYYPVLSGSHALGPAPTGLPPAPGSTVYTCMLNHRGGTESDLTVSRLAPSAQASPLAPAFEGKRCHRGHRDAALPW